MQTKANETRGKQFKALFSFWRRILVIAPLYFGEKEKKWRLSTYFSRPCFFSHIFSRRLLKTTCKTAKKPGFHWHSLWWSAFARFALAFAAYHSFAWSSRRPLTEGDTRFASHTLDDHRQFILFDMYIIMHSVSSTLSLRNGTGGLTAMRRCNYWFSQLQVSLNTLNPRDDPRNWNSTATANFLFLSLFSLLLFVPALYVTGRLIDSFSLVCTCTRTRFFSDRWSRSSRHVGLVFWDHRLYQEHCICDHTERVCPQSGWIYVSWFQIRFQLENCKIRESLYETTNFDSNWDKANRKKQNLLYYYWKIEKNREIVTFSAKLAKN